MTFADPIEIPVADGPVHARVSLPGSKSYTNRALPLAALASGASTLRGALDSDDTRYMVAALNELGIETRADWERSEINVCGHGGRIPTANAALYLGNSGTSMRFLTAMVALGQGRYQLDGNERMRQRPLGPLLAGLRELGIDAHSVDGTDCPPIVVNAAGLPGGSLAMPGDVSSQFFSALAMVLPFAREPLEVRVIGDLVSKPYLDMTADAMSAFGVVLRHEDYQRFWVEPGTSYQPRDYDIEPDASAASYFFALAAITGGSVTVERLPPESRQGDIRFVDVLEQMGCRIERTDDDITVHGPQRLYGVDVDMNAISDTVQTLAAIAPYASSPVTIRNVRHIRFKETDRIAATATELRRMKIPVEEGDDWLQIHPAQPQPATINTYDDHRMAMSFALTGARAAGIRIADPRCVSKTVPQFWNIYLPLLRPIPVAR